MPERKTQSAAQKEKAMETAGAVRDRGVLKGGGM